MKIPVWVLKASVSMIKTDMFCIKIFGRPSNEVTISDMANAGIKMNIVSNEEADWSLDEDAD
jgi:hypothetical protein